MWISQENCSLEKQKFLPKKGYIRTHANITIKIVLNKKDINHCKSVRYSLRHKHRQILDCSQNIFHYFDRDDWHKTLHINIKYFKTYKTPSTYIILINNDLLYIVLLRRRTFFIIFMILSFLKRHSKTYYRDVCSVKAMYRCWHFYTIY